jgi:hypothetical protein
MSCCLGCADWVWVWVWRGQLKRRLGVCGIAGTATATAAAPKPRTSTAPSEADRAGTPRAPTSKRSRLSVLSDKENACVGMRRGSLVAMAGYLGQQHQPHRTGDGSSKQVLANRNERWRVRDGLRGVETCGWKRKCAVGTRHGRRVAETGRGRLHLLFGPPADCMDVLQVRTQSFLLFLFLF